MLAASKALKWAPRVMQLSRSEEIECQWSENFTLQPIALVQEMKTGHGKMRNSDILFGKTQWKGGPAPTKGKD